TDVQASSNISFTNAAGSVTRTTGTTQNVTSGCTSNCGNAGKNWQAPGGQITPTQTTCQDFASGTSPTLGQINYSLTGGNKIGQGINPGVFFFYTRITTTTPGQVVTVTQTNTSTNSTPPFGIQNGQANLLTTGCTSVAPGTVSGTNSSQASF